MCLGLSLIPVRGDALEVSVTAPGAPDELQDRLRAASSSMSATGNGMGSAQELMAAANSDYRTMVQVMYDAGYFSPVVHVLVNGREAATISPLDPPAKVDRIAITVTPGPPFRFGRASIAPLAPETELPAEFASGQPAGTGTIVAAASAGVKGWQRQGHAKAKTGAQHITARHADAVLDAEIELLPGQKLRFGKMTISGETAVNRDAIERIAGFPEGEVYHPDLVQKVGTRLRRTGTFSSVALVEADNANPDGTLDFDAEITDQAPRRITFGAQLTSRSGLDLSARWLHRNLFGNAERLSLEGRLRNIGGTEDIDGLFAIRLDRPASLGPDDNVFYLGELEQLNQPHFTLTRLFAGAGVRRVFSDELFAEAALMVGTSKADDVFGKRDFNLLTLPVNAEWDKRDNPISATEGFFVNAQVTPFTGFSGSESGIRAFFDTRGYLSLGSSGRVVLAGRVQLGSVLGASLSDISPDMLFYSGGAGTVRGQPYQSLGVPVAGGISGGRSFLGASAEIRGRVTEKISLVGFFDIGAVDEDRFVDGNSPFHSGAGLGVRYDLGGLGPLRLDLALPVDGTTNDGLQFYLGIGQAF